MLRRTFLLAIGILVLASAASAQSYGILRGRVFDQNRAAVTGATVALSGEQLQGVRTVITDEGGEFSFLGLMPATNYKIRVTSTGFKELIQENIAVRGAQTIELNPVLEVAGTTASVDVTSGADSPIIDTSTPEKNYNIPGEFITQLPLNPRQSWEALWTMVPGVNGFPDGPNYDPVVNGAGIQNQGTPQLGNNFQVGGQGIVNTVSNAYSLDGFRIGDSFTNQGWRTQFSTEAIQDVVVKTAGADASTPLAQGGAVDVVTKSGGNDFHGSAGVFIQPRKFNWTNIPNGTSSTLTLVQPDLAFGGPVVIPMFGESNRAVWKGKDKLWFFMTYRQARADRGIARSESDLAYFRNLGLEPPTFDEVERSNRFTGKITYQANRNHTFIFNYINDSGTVFSSNAQPRSLEIATLDQRAGGPGYQFAWNGNFGSKFLWTAQYGQRTTNVTQEIKGGDEPARTLYPAVQVGTGGNLMPLGNSLLLYGNSSNGARTFNSVRPYKEFTSDITALTSFAGDHTLQAGVLYRPALKDVSVTTIAPSGITHIDEYVNNGARVPFRRFRWEGTEFPENERSTKQIGFYVQDKWTINPRLSVTIGGRFDNQKGIDALDTTIIDVWTFNPRLGFAWSLNKSGRDVIRGSWGRYSDLLTVAGTPTISGSGRTLGNPAGVYDYDNDGDGIFENTVVITPATGYNPANTTAGGLTKTIVDPNLKVSYKDELQLGYTRQLPFRVVLDASYIHSDFKDLVGTLNINRVYTNGLFTGLVDPAFNDVLLRTNLPNYNQSYRSFQLSLIRNVGARYSFFANYTYQTRKLSGEFPIDDPNRYYHPADWFADDRQVRPHLIALNGDAKLPWGFKAAAVFTFESGTYGRALERAVPTTDTEYTQHVASIQVVGPNGTRNVTNYLRSTVRLLGPRSEGRLQLPWRPRLNLRLGKNFKLPWESQRIETAVDIFNLFNEATPLGFFSTSAQTRPDLPGFGRLSETFVGSPRGVQLSFRYRF